MILNTDLEKDLAYCPIDLSNKEEKIHLYGSLDRLSTNTPWVGDTYLDPEKLISPVKYPNYGILRGGKIDTYHTPRPEPVAPSEIQNVSQYLSNKADVAGKWIIPQMVLYGNLQTECNLQMKVYNVQFPKQPKNCSFSYESATELLRANGFYEVGAVSGLPVSKNITDRNLLKLKSCKYGGFRKTKYGITVRNYGASINTFSAEIAGSEQAFNKPNNQVSSYGYDFLYSDASWIKRAEQDRQNNASFYCKSSHEGNLIFTDTTLWIHDGGVPLTFNTMDTAWRNTQTSTFELLSKIMYPFQSINILSVDFPPVARAVRTKPRTLSKLLKDTYDTQSNYASRKGGFWQIINVRLKITVSFETHNKQTAIESRTNFLFSYSMTSSTILSFRAVG